MHSTMSAPSSAAGTRYPASRFATVASRLPSTIYNPQRGYILDLTSEDGAGTLERTRAAFAEKDIRYRLLEYDARGRKAGLTKVRLAVEEASGG